MSVYKDFESLIADELVSEQEILPNCFTEMRPEFVEYTSGEKITWSYPVLDIYSNPQGSMQGGIIGVAFDNTFGSLVVLVARTRCMTTIDLNISYHKPIFQDRLYVTAYMKSLGKKVIYMTGEAYDRDQQLIASANSKCLLLTPR